MKTSYVLAAVLLAYCAGARAEETVIRLTVQPMAAPKPALKYRLLPDLRELQPGNPVHGYLRCFAEQHNFFFGKGQVEMRARYQTAPLAELRAEKVGDYGGRLLRDVDGFARHETPDWQLTSRVLHEGMDLPLPALSHLQILAAALHVRLRGQIAHQRFDDAITTAKTMFALARHLGKYPAEVGNRLGLAVADLAADALLEMVQESGCPNLYWALTDLPSPLVELRKGIQGDAALVANDLRAIRDERPMTEEEIESVVKRLSGVMSFMREQAGRPPYGFRAQLKKLVAEPERVEAARRRLPAERVKRFPAAQLILLDEKYAYETRRDEALKLLGLAPWQIEALAETPAAEGLLSELAPDIAQSRRLQARLEQRLAVLRHIEALRLYAAAHEGRVPDALPDLNVPVPVDPFTGQAFGYAVTGGTVELRGTAAQWALSFQN